MLNSENKYPFLSCSKLSKRFELWWGRWSRTPGGRALRFLSLNHSQYGSAVILRWRGLIGCAIWCYEPSEGIVIRCKQKSVKYQMAEDLIAPLWIQFFSVCTSKVLFKWIFTKDSGVRYHPTIESVVWQWFKVKWQVLVCISESKWPDLWSKWPNFDLIFKI